MAQSELTCGKQRTETRTRSITCAAEFLSEFDAYLGAVVVGRVDDPPVVLGRVRIDPQEIRACDLALAVVRVIRGLPRTVRAGF